jgi:hypothetical protein
MSDSGAGGTVTRVEDLCFDQDGLRVVTGRAGDHFDSSIAGVAEPEVGDRLAGYLRTLHQRATADGVKQVVVDLAQLEVLNAVCLRSFVTWIQDLQELPRGKQYLVRFRPNHQLPWQRRSINALRCFAADLITVEAGS